MLGLGRIGRTYVVVVTLLAALSAVTEAVWPMELALPLLLPSAVLLYPFLGLGVQLLWIATGSPESGPLWWIDAAALVAAFAAMAWVNATAVRLVAGAALDACRWCRLRRLAI